MTRKPVVSMAGALTYISLRTPAALRATLISTSRAQGCTLRALCHQTIAAFVQHTEALRRRNSLGPDHFVATYKATGGARIGFWMDAELAQRVEHLAASGHVSRRAFCYTAFTRAFPLNQLGASP
jgi:hypothetical protein